MIDKLNVEITFDRPFANLQKAEHAAERFENELRREILHGADDGGPWGFGVALVKSVVVRTAAEDEVPA